MKSVPIDVVNPETMLRIHESEKAIREGRVREIHSVQDMLDEIDHREKRTN